VIPGYAPIGVGARMASLYTFPTPTWWRAKWAEAIEKPKNSFLDNVSGFEKQKMARVADRY